MEEKEGTRKRTAVALEEEEEESESQSSSSSSVQLKTRRLDANFCCSDEGSSSCEVTKPNFFKLVDLLKEEEEEVTREFVADDSVDFNHSDIMMPLSEAQIQSGGELESTAMPLNSRRRSLTNEIELFFAAVERDTHKRFIAKYNFDIIKDQPLEEGRYEWVPIHPHPSTSSLI